MYDAAGGGGPSRAGKLENAKATNDEMESVLDCWLFVIQNCVTLAAFLALHAGLDPYRPAMRRTMRSGSVVGVYVCV